MSSFDSHAMLVNSSFTCIYRENVDLCPMSVAHIPACNMSTTSAKCNIIISLAQTYMEYNYSDIFARNRHTGKS